MSAQAAVPHSVTGNKRGLAHLEEVLAVREQRVTSLVLMRIEELPEVRLLYGSEVYQAAMAEIQRTLTKLVRGRGIGARTGPTEFALAFPGLYRREALALVSIAMGKPPRFEFNFEEHELILLPEIAADLIGADQAVRDVHGRLRTELMTSLELERARLEAMFKRNTRRTRATPAIA